MADRKVFKAIQYLGTGKRRGYPQYVEEPSQERNMTMWFILYVIICRPNSMAVSSLEYDMTPQWYRTDGKCSQPGRLPTSLVKKILEKMAKKKANFNL